MKLIKTNNSYKKLLRPALLASLFLTAMLCGLFAAPRVGLAAMSIKVDDIIGFGAYSWRVLDVQNGMALILSERVIEERAYNEIPFETYIGVTWETCTLREYLNGEFYNRFNAKEKARIVKTRAPNNDNPWYVTRGGNATDDYIFLLSLEELVKYYGDTGRLRSRPSGEEGIDDRFSIVRIAENTAGKLSWWWLRSPGSHGKLAAGVHTDGWVNVLGYYVDGSGGVRPALWLKL